MNKLPHNKEVFYKDSQSSSSQLLEIKNKKRIFRVPLLPVGATIMTALLAALWIFSENVTTVQYPTQELATIETKLAEPARSASFVDRSQEETLIRSSGSPVNLKAEFNPDLPLLGGDGKIVGKVDAPTLITSGVIVELARWEKQFFNTLRVEVDEQGRFEINDAVGGRWSARAWAPPKFSRGETQKRFLLTNKTVEVNLDLGREAEDKRTITVTPPDRTFDSFVISVEVNIETVDDNGAIIKEDINEELRILLPANYEGPNNLTVENSRGSIIVECVRPSTASEERRRGIIIFEDGQETAFIAPTCARRPTPSPTIPPGPPPPPPPTTPPTTNPTPPTTPPTTNPPTPPTTRPPVPTTRPPSTTTTTTTTPRSATQQQMYRDERRFHP